MPLPGTKVIHALWSRHHQPVATGVMTAQCQITRADGAGTTEADGTWHTGTRLSVYVGPARVVRLPATDGHPVMGEDRLTTRRYLVQIPFEAPNVDTGDSVEIYESNDPQLTGRKLRVDGVLVGSEVWSRDLVAVEFEEGT